MSTMTIDIDKIRRDGGTQSRENLNENTVAEYKAAMLAGDTFPSVKVFYDGTDYWLADGFHRVKAASEANATVIQADVHQGTQRDAVLDSTGANSKHGLRRTQEDVRRAINTLLNDSQWAKWSDREISRRVGCDHKTVASARAKLSGEIPQTRTVERNGTTYEMTTSAKPAIVNSVGRGFEIGDVVRITEQNGYDRSYGQIASIDGDDVILDFVTSRARKETPKTLTVSRVKIFPIKQVEYVQWYCNGFHNVGIVLFPWKDYYVSFNAPYIKGWQGADSVSWKPVDGDSWDTGTAYRFHPTCLKHWDEAGVSYGVVQIESVSPEMLEVIGSVGRARGKVNMPEVMMAKPFSGSVEAECPEWAKVGCAVRLKANWQSAGFVERSWTSNTGALMVRVRDRRYGFMSPVADLEPCEEGYQLPQAIWNEDQLASFRKATQNLLSFLDFRLIPEGNFLADLELVEKAVRVARDEYDKHPKLATVSQSLQTLQDQN